MGVETINYLYGELSLEEKTNYVMFGNDVLAAFGYKKHLDLKDEHFIVKHTALGHPQGARSHRSGRLAQSAPATSQGGQPMLPHTPLNSHVHDSTPHYGPIQDLNFFNVEPNQPPTSSVDVADMDQHPPSDADMDQQLPADTANQEPTSSIDASADRQHPFDANVDQQLPADTANQHPTSVDANADLDHPPSNADVDQQLPADTANQHPTSVDANADLDHPPSNADVDQQLPADTANQHPTSVDANADLDHPPSNADVDQQLPADTAAQQMPVENEQMPSQSQLSHSRAAPSKTTRRSKSKRGGNTGDALSEEFRQRADSRKNLREQLRDIYPRINDTIEEIRQQKLLVISEKYLEFAYLNAFLHTILIEVPTRRVPLNREQMEKVFLEFLREHYGIRRNPNFLTQNLIQMYIDSISILNHAGDNISIGVIDESCFLQMEGDLGSRLSELREQLQGLNTQKENWEGQLRELGYRTRGV